MTTVIAPTNVVTISLSARKGVATAVLTTTVKGVKCEKTLVYTEKTNWDALYTALHDALGALKFECVVNIEPKNWYVQWLLRGKNAIVACTTYMDVARLHDVRFVSV